MVEVVFSLKEANKLVPYLEDCFNEICDLRTGARKAGERIAQITSFWGGQASEGFPDSEEVSSLKKGVTFASSRLQELMLDIHESGIIVKDLDLGLVDFASTTKTGEKIYLCWCFGEKSVQYWHKADEGNVGKRSVAELQATPCKVRRNI